MSLQYLLLWLSAKGQGSWSQFRGAVEELCSGQDNGALEADDDGQRTAYAGSDLPLFQRVRFALERLGHVEFYSNELGQKWRVVPPALALLPRRPGEGVLCGARSPNLLHRLDREFEVDRVAAIGMPDRIVVTGSPDAVALGAARLDLLVQPDAPTTILSAVPGARDTATWLPMALPENPGWAVHRFSSSHVSWAESSSWDALNAQTGLFRFAMGHQRFYCLRWRGGSYRVQVQVGKYAVMRRRRGLLRYDTSSLTLSVPAVCRPPPLIERALVLCSGFLPSFDALSGRVVYGNVLPDVASLVAQLLQQEVAT